MPWFKYLCVFLSFGLLTACAQVDNTTQPVALKPIQSQVHLQKLWQQQVGAGSDGQYLRLQPAIAHQTIFADSYQGHIYAYGIHKGHLKWHHHLSAHITSGLAVGNGAVYVGTEKGTLYALSQKDGHVLWQHNVANAVLATPAYDHHQVFAKSLDGTVAAYDAKSGHRQWRYQSNVPVVRLYAAGQPRVKGKRVIVGLANGQLLAFNRHSGDVLWQQQIAYPKGSNPVQQMVDITVAPQISDQHVFIASYQGKAAAVDLDSGNPLWEHDVSSYAGIVKGDKSLYVVDAQGHIRSFASDDGMINWHNKTLQGRRLSAPALMKHHLLVGDLAGYLHVINADDGNEIGRIQASDHAIRARPLVKGKRIFVYSKDGQLTAVQIS